MVTGSLEHIMLAVLTPWHIGILLILVLILFGGKKLPELARGMGRGLRIFKEEMSTTKKSLQEAMDSEPEHTPQAPKQMQAEKPATPPTNQQTKQPEKDEHLN